MADERNTAPKLPDDISTVGLPRRVDVCENVDVPGYEILSELGRGGMGIVYKARHLRLGRIVALKMILSGQHAGPEHLARFLNEARAVASLQHPNIVQIYEISEHEGRPFFTLEYVEGGSLADKVRDRPLPAMEAAAIVERLARGLHVAHNRGIIHRDLKPANVLLAADGTPKISDFGLAKQIESGLESIAGEGLTQSGAIFGTPSYMAPEQAAGKGKSVGGGADVYGLGAILYRLVTGRPPFQAATVLDTVMQVVRIDPVPPSRLVNVPRDLETIILKCLQKKASQRYTTAFKLAEDLHRFQAGEPIRARPIGFVERTVRWIRRKPAQAAVAAAVVVLLGAAMWYIDDRARQKADESVRRAEARRKQDLASQSIAQVLTQTEKVNRELDELLRKPGGVFVLLNEPTRWEAQIRVLRAGLQQAQALMTSGLESPSQELQERIERLQSVVTEADIDRTFALRLDKIRSDIEVSATQPERTAGRLSEYPKAFAERGLSILDEDAAMFAKRVTASAIKEQIVAALDGWATLEIFVGRVDRADKLFAITKLASPDPDLGDIIRDPARWPISDSVLDSPDPLMRVLHPSRSIDEMRRNLGKQRTIVDKLFGQPVVDRKVSPQTALLAAVFLAQVDANNQAHLLDLEFDEAKKKLPLTELRAELKQTHRESWLRKAQAWYPSDFFLNVAMGNALLSSKPGEAEGFFRAAMAVRPDYDLMHYELGNVLQRQGRGAEATTYYRKAIELDSDEDYRKLGPELLVEYFPVPRGAHWSYVASKNVDGPVPIPFVVKVAAIARRGKDLRVELQTTNDTKLWEPYDTLLLNHQGVFSVRGSEKAQVPPLARLKYPLEEGQTWSTEVSVLTKKVSFTTSVGKKVRVTVEFGTFNAIPVTETVSDGETTTEVVQWYAPHVGIVKMSSGRPGRATIMELATFAIVK